MEHLQVLVERWREQAKRPSPTVCGVCTNQCADELEAALKTPSGIEAAFVQVAREKDADA